MADNVFNDNDIYVAKELFAKKDIACAPILQMNDRYHTHDYWEIFFFVSGNATHYFNGTVGELSPRELFILRPGDKHLIKMHATGEQYLHWDIYITDKTMQETANFLTPDGSLYENLKNGRIPLFFKLERSSFDMFLTLLSRRQDSNEEILLKTIVSHILAMPSLSHDDALPEAPSYIKKLYNFIRANCTDKETIKQYINDIGYCSEHIGRQFKKYTGLSIRDHIVNCKLDYSKILLRATENTITIISSALGFSCDASFIASFKQKFGITPAKWRKSLQTEFSKSSVK